MNNTLKYNIWVIVVTLWYTICFIAPYFHDVPAEGFKGVLTIFTYICACGIGTYFLLYLIGINRYINTALLPLLSFIGATLSFYRIGYNATLTPMLIDVILHTNIEEAVGITSWQVILWVSVNILIACVFVSIRWKKIRLTYSWFHALCALALGVMCFFCNERLQKSLCQRFPYNIPYNIYEYVLLQQSYRTSRQIPEYKIVDNNDSLSIVLILGEAARADHLQLNGYERHTNPRLTKRKNLVSFPHIYCEHTHTIASLPYILTRADSVNAEYQHSETSFISIFKECGFHTSWISNQDLGTTFSMYLNECDTSVFANAEKTVYVFSQWLDEELIPKIPLVKDHDSHKSLTIFHTIGSHWYYNNHVREDMQIFQPTTINKVVTANSIEQLVNSYDNTIYYMDYFVDSIISTLEDSNSIVLYQSDHGEALGEDGYFLHANESEFAKNPACFIWYSDKYAAKNPDKIKAIIANKNKRYRTDYVFYSILYAAGIEAEGDNAQVNIFR